MSELEPGNEQLRRFAAELARELDRLSFPENPVRLMQLTELLGLSRSQVYRINSGEAFPTLNSLLKLRQCGVSFDAVLDAVAGGPPSSINQLSGVLLLDGMRFNCRFEAGRGSDLNAPFTAIAQDDRSWLLRVTQECAAHELRAGAMPVRNLSFVTERARIALVDDDPLTLEVLRKAFETHFEVDYFDRASALVSRLGEVDYHAYVLDWRLPDMRGQDLVMAVRRASPAPIMLLTGEAGSWEVARAIENADVLYCAKPVDPVILVSSLSNAIRKHQPQTA